MICFRMWKDLLRDVLQLLPGVEWAGGPCVYSLPWDTGSQVTFILWEYIIFYIIYYILAPKIWNKLKWKWNKISWNELKWNATKQMEKWNENMNSNLKWKTNMKMNEKRKKTWNKLKRMKQKYEMKETSFSLQIFFFCGSSTNS